MDNASPGSQLKASITEASRKIESIIDDAESAAADIKAQARAEAEQESRRAVSESAAQLATVVEPLIKRVESLRVEAAALMHELETATLGLVEVTRLTAEPAFTVDRAPAEPESIEPAFEEDHHRAPGFSSPGPPPVSYPGQGSGKTGHPPEEAVLRATQMAVAGNSRAEIEITLREEFDLADATPVVNDILGP